MAVLSSADRLAVRRAYMAWWSWDSEAAKLDKDELIAAIEAADTWSNNNASDFNQALPTAARTKLSARQKAKLLMVVTDRRFEVS